MDERKQQDFEAAFRALRRAYIGRLYNTARIIDNILALEKIVPLSRNDLLRAQALVHGLAGSGATFGFPEITQTGQQADCFVEEILSENGTGARMNPQQQQTFLRLLQNAQKACLDVYNSARREDPALSRPASNDAADRHRSAAHILIVEDDGEASSAIGLALEAAGMSLHKLSSGAEGLHYLARVHPDLVLLDMNLTDINGMEVLQQIKQNAEFLDVPVIILAARYNEGDKNFSLQAGAAAYLPKPVDTDALVKSVRSIIHHDAASAQSI